MIKDVMTSVMAALNTFGIEYDTNIIGAINLHERAEELLKEDTINFDQEDFKKKFVGYISIPHYDPVRGYSWAEEEHYVLIQFSRDYNMDQQDWDDYAAMCGCSDPFEAQCLYGDPNVKKMKITVRIPKGKIYSFLQDYAKYCWE